MVWNSIYRIVVTFYVTILTIYKTRMVMQRGHAGATLTSLQSRALTMLPKHNNLNTYVVLSSYAYWLAFCVLTCLLFYVFGFVYIATSAE
jgi:hypothetical protein